MPLGGGAGRGGLLQPKVKYKYRIRVVQFGPLSGGLEFTQQVQTASRPKIQYEPQAVHSYNSVAYYAGKHAWQEIEITLRDDVTNSITTLVGYQIQKQMNNLEQTSFEAGINYKFTMFLEILDGGNDVVLEQWFLEGCFLSNVDYGGLDYADSSPVMLTLSVRYDNATQTGGIMPDAPSFVPGVRT